MEVSSIGNRRVERYTLFFLLNLITVGSFASEAMIWRCLAIDRMGQTWKSTSSYVKSAQASAHALCKKESRNPWQCFSSRELCEVFRFGNSRASFWRCTAYNQKNNEKWRSGPYGARLEAAAGALGYCEQFSKYPDSCYINMLTCKKIK
ncbi:MAG: hypothetical protein JJT82_10870 [Legionellaceae bacterium]|nr:hypothetical protein [Legionellaceae bacterium]